MVFILYIVLGLLLAGFEAVLFIRFSKNIIANAAGVLGGIGVIIGIWEYSYSVLQIENLKVPTLLCFVTSFGIGFCISLWIFSRVFINKIDNKYSLRMIDILIGDVKALENHTLNRQKQIDKDLNFQDLCEQKQELDRQEKRIKEETQNLKKIKSKIDKSVSKEVHIELPENFKYPITNEFMNKIEHYVNCLLNLDLLICDTTKQFIEDKQENFDKDRYMFLKSYFFSLCFYTSTVLFGNNEGVRTHVRCLKGDYYETIACCVGATELEESLTKIPIKKGMIWKANNKKQSLMKSCNMDDHYNANNDYLWKDYITIPIVNIKNNKEPIISIGISIKYPDLHSDMLRFYNFIKIENIFIKNICNFNKNYDILDIISREV